MLIPQTLTLTDAPLAMVHCALNRCYPAPLLTLMDASLQLIRASGRVAWGANTSTGPLPRPSEMLYNAKGEAQGPEGKDPLFVYDCGERLRWPMATACNV